MFIKSINISGFRSYSGETANQLSDLSAGHNVIVGRNGCGKTNILNAIQFVLSDEYNHLDSNQRQQLMNQSNGRLRVLMSFVEIVIDNTDRRIPLESNEIVFRRQIGLKKNQYFLNNKIITPSEIASMLEAAGFSRSNPYYIVKQGKVNELATASDDYRLQIMREVAGTRTYDQKKAQSLKLLAETRLKSEQIDECLQSLDNKFNSLQNESKNLQTFQKWDKRRRLLEYLIADKESENMKKQIHKLVDKLEDENKVLEEKQQKLQELQQKSKDCDKKLKIISNVVQQYRKDMKDITKSVDELNEKKVKIESEINDFNEKLKFNSENDKKIAEKLKAVKKVIAEKKKKLVAVNAKYEEHKNKENQLFNELKAKQSRKTELYSKQKRKESFRTIDERNRWIRSELTKLDRDIDVNNKRIRELKEEHYSVSKAKDQLENQQKTFTAEEEQLLNGLPNNKQKICDLNKEIKQMESKRSQLWDSENQLKESELKLIEEKSKIESKLTKFSGTSAIIGRQSVRNVLDIFEQKASNSSEGEARLRPIIDGYMGQVIDCFSFEANLTKAIEVTTKSKLFYHIVKTDRIGTQIIGEINRNHMLGDITFIAINKLNVKPVKYPDLKNDARPLSSLIKYDEKYKTVMKYLFDRILVCRNLEVASIYSRSAKLDCVTIDGDFVSHKGLMSGGYIGTDTRIQLFNIWNKLVEKMDDIHQKMTEVSKQKEINEKHLFSKQKELSDLDIDQNKTKRKLENLMASKIKNRNNLNDLNKIYESLTKSIVSLESTLPSMIANKESFESELELSLDSQLNEQENQELDSIIKDIQELSGKHTELCHKRNKLGVLKSSLESDLEKNLEQRKNELELDLINSKIMENETLVENESIDCNIIEEKINCLRKELEEKNQNIDRMVKQLNEQKEMSDNLKLAEDKQMDIINNEAKKSRKITIQLENIRNKYEEYLKRARNIGTIPSDADTNYRNISLSDKYRELQRTNQKLSKLTNVNQKALVQLNEIKEKVKLLTAEKKQIDLGYKSIGRLIETLEHQKYEAIQITYRQVSQFFTKTFSKLVPGGKAFIDMVYQDTNGVNGSQSSQSQSLDSQSSGGMSGIGPTPLYQKIDNFSGVKIRVAFSGTAVIKEMNQLSGGQKSIVALAFIFAIQMCDPAPFYLFDEVDQALDPLYRTALADMIKELSENSQFITTTFRPELLECGHKFFGVKSINRVSRVAEITKELAKEFIESDSGTDQRSRARTKSVRFDETANSVNQ